VLLLSDGQLRDQFETELDAFLSAVDTVLPDPRALAHLPAAKLFAEIAKRARRRYREAGDFDPSLYGEKVRELIDEHTRAPARRRWNTRSATTSASTSVRTRSATAA
jgi:type I restriction enzyme R subunit